MPLLRTPVVLVILSAAALAAQPLLGLSATWRGSAGHPAGTTLAAAMLVLLAWSLTSEQLPDTPSSRRYALLLLALSTLLGSVGRVLRVHALAQLTLALELYALSVLGGVHWRRRALSPGWLATLCAVALPLEQALQRALLASRSVS
jgi:hypothetical protein